MDSLRKDRRTVKAMICFVQFLYDATDVVRCYMDEACASTATMSDTFREDVQDQAKKVSVNLDKVDASMAKVREAIDKMYDAIRDANSKASSVMGRLWDLVDDLEKLDEKLEKELKEMEEEEEEKQR